MKKIQVLTLSIICLLGCTTDFIEPNLEGKTIRLLAPANNYSSPAFTVTFWWEELKGASGYRLQVVDSSFSYIQGLELDTLVTGTQFSFTLAPGNYQWRLRAENNSSHTDYSTARNLHIDTTASLGNQTVVLLSPAQNLCTNQATTTFKWNTLPSADDYRFQLINMTTNSTVTDVVIQADSFNYTLAQGQYQWQVRGQNATSNTLYSSRIINIDLAAPGAPSLSAPLDGAMVNNPVTLSWSHDVSATADSLYVYADSLYTTVLNAVYTTSQTYNFNGVSFQTYFWRVRSADNAGNWSAFSTRRKFYIQ
jgi:hypothetical protein